MRSCTSTRGALCPMRKATVRTSRPCQDRGAKASDLGWVQVPGWRAVEIRGARFRYLYTMGYTGNGLGRWHAYEIMHTNP